MLFKKTSDDGQVNAEIESLRAELAALTAETEELRAFKAHTEAIDQLQAKSSELGYEVTRTELTELFAKNEGDMAKAYGAVISGFSAQVASRKEDIQTNSAEEDEGSNEPSEDFVAHNQTEAVNYVKATYGVVGREAVTKARELFPNAF